LGRELGSIPPALPSITRPTAVAGGALAAAKRRAVPRWSSSQAQAQPARGHQPGIRRGWFRQDRGRACRSV